MNGLYSCIIAISMYSKIPMPNVEWSEDRMRYVMCFFPLVGIVQGAALGLWLHLALDVLNLSVGAVALTGAAIPLLVTGGIHMDGFLDTMDAIHSYGDRSRKLEILKDPHLGAFAVISFGVYMMLYLGVFHEYLSLVLREDRGDRYFLYAVPCLGFVMERAFSGLSVVTFPQAKKKGLAAGFGGAAKKKADSLVLLLWMLICLGAGAAAVKMGCRGAGTAKRLPGWRRRPRAGASRTRPERFWTHTRIRRWPPKGRSSPPGTCWWPAGRETHWPGRWYGGLCICWRPRRSTSGTC